MSSEDGFEQAIQDGMNDSDRSMAERLSRCSPFARAVWAALMTVDRRSAPILALAERFEGRNEETRAALVVLHAVGLIGFDPVDALVSPCGIWLGEVEKVLGGAQGSALYPTWSLPSKWVCVSTSEKL